MLENMIGGALRPGDPRRYLVEAMVGAMNADGHVDPRELEVLHRQLAEHALFEHLSGDVARTLIDLASDAIRHADDGRVRAIARGLPWRTHRLAAYAMACEVCAADGHFHQSELDYLYTLERRMRLSKSEVGELFSGARDGHAMAALASQLGRLAQVSLMVIECFALQHCMERRVLDRHKRRLVEFLTPLVDMHLGADEIRAKVERALDPLNHSRNVAYGLHKLVEVMPDPTDRYWIAVYIAAGYRRRGVSEWQELPFAETMCAAFAIPTLDGVADHASRLVEEPPSKATRISRQLATATMPRRGKRRSKRPTSPTQRPPLGAGESGSSD